MHYGGMQLRLLFQLIWELCSSFLEGSAPLLDGSSLASASVARASLTFVVCAAFLVSANQLASARHGAGGDQKHPPKTKEHRTLQYTHDNWGHIRLDRAWASSA